MTERQYISGHGSGVEPSYVTSLLEAVRRDGYVIIHDLISADIVQRIREESAPFLTHDGRNAIEGHNTRRIYSVIDKTLAQDPGLQPDRRASTGVGTA